MSTSPPPAGKVFSTYFGSTTLQQEEEELQEEEEEELQEEEEEGRFGIFAIQQICSGFDCWQNYVGVPSIKKSKITKTTLKASKLPLQIKTFTGMPLFDFCPLPEQKVLGKLVPGEEKKGGGANTSGLANGQQPETKKTSQEWKPTTTPPRVARVA